MKIAGAIATGALVVLYPIAIWVGLTYLSARTVGLWILLLLVPSLALRYRRASREDLKVVLRVPLAILAVLLLGVLFDDARFVLAMPVLISVVLLATFGASLASERSMVERFARMQEARRQGVGSEEVALSGAQRAHCRQVTWVWCVFFVFNASVAGGLALVGPLAWWAAYTSGVAYLLMGALFTAEYLVRQYRFRRYGAGLHDRLLSRILPPREP